MAEPQTHHEHATAAKDYAKRGYYDKAQYHATMAVYEALTLPGYGMSLGEKVEHDRKLGR